MVLPSMMRFNLGRLIITPSALMGVDAEEIYYAIDRHVCGIWGDVSEAARTTNESALASRAPLLSVYRLADGTALRVLTTDDRLTTTVDLPGECNLPTDTERTPIWTPTEYCRITGNPAK